ncbi:XtrA/YqaO family protein [Bacillus gobiensis]|uniref:XtrA/YqaO family protein n=1 Tax=Bacillus gobiensis TaxID=1441095 RepID=UPI003D19CA08
MNQPKELSINEDLSFTERIKPGEVSIIVLDGNEGTAYVLDAPEHGETIIQTIKGGLARLDYKIGHKFK